MQTLLQSDPSVQQATTFDRIVVGIDGSPESLEAARQAATLAEGPVSLLAAYDLAAGLVGGTGPAVPAYLDERPLREEAEQALAVARAELGGRVAPGTVARGRAWRLLLDEIERDDADLVAVGSHGSSRALGVVLGSTATELIHRAPCSVLVARNPLHEFPRRIVVGLDGSEESAAAYEVAQAITNRFESELDPIVARVGVERELGAIDEAAGRYRTVSDPPVGALVTHSADADLLVVGSRGLHGLKALGSVSERVAHQAACSVLIVRRQS